MGGQIASWRLQAFVIVIHSKDLLGCFMLLVCQKSSLGCNWIWPCVWHFILCKDSEAQLSTGPLLCQLALMHLQVAGQTFLTCFVKLTHWPLIPHSDSPLGLLHSLSSIQNEAKFPWCVDHCSKGLHFQVRTMIWACHRLPKNHWFDSLSIDSPLRQSTGTASWSLFSIQNTATQLGGWTTAAWGWVPESETAVHDLNLWQTLQN